MKGKARQDDNSVTVEVPSFAPRKALPTQWTADLVGGRLIQAFITLDLLPPVPGPRAPGDHWQSALVEWGDKVARAGLPWWEQQDRNQEANKTVVRPTSEEITHMEMVFEWLKELRAVEPGAALVATFWALRTARGRSIRALCIEKRWSRRTFFRKREKAMESMAGRLNARGVPVF